MKLRISNPGKTIGYMMLHQRPPDDFVSWSEEEQQEWAQEQRKQYPPVAIPPGFDGEVEMPTPEYTTGVQLKTQS